LAFQDRSDPELLAEAERLGLPVSPEARTLLEEGEQQVQTPAASLANGSCS
jgi:hypothetical protein